MNLFEMLARRDPTLIACQGTSPVKLEANGATWRCLRVPAGSAPQLQVQTILRWHPFRTRPDQVGWHARAVAGQGNLAVRLAGKDGILSEISVAIGHVPVPVPLPWPVSLAIPGPDTRLELHFDADADLLVNEVMDRRPLIALARGTGIEIGPGPKPQILPDDAIRVRYLEEMPQERWAANYDNTARRGAREADWSGYLIGTADQVPVEDGSLDFVFMSHVFEHLANPIGHLEHWSRKLRPGGAVLVVCPDIAGGSRDYSMTLSTLEEMEAEHAASLWRPAAHHYERYAASRGTSAEKLRDAQYSIHVHFYGRENTAALLHRCVARGLFGGFNLVHRANNKDFYFTCVKAA